MRLKNTATTTRTIKREPLFKQEPFGTRVLWLLPMLLVSLVSVVYAWIIQRKGYYKSKYTHTVAHTPPSPSHTHTRSALVCIYEHIFFMCISLDFVVVRMETRLSNWKFLLPPRLLQFRAIPLQFPLLLYSLLFLSSSHSPSPSPSPSCRCCCSRWRSKF